MRPWASGGRVKPGHDGVSFDAGQRSQPLGGKPVLPSHQPPEENIMASANESEKSPVELENRVWELAEKLRFCMFSSWDGEKQHQRPLTAMPDKHQGAIYFLVDEAGSKNWEVEKYPTVALAFMDGGKNEYLTIAGHADLSNDRAKIKQLFSPFAKAWWDSADDPDIRLLTVFPREAEIWEGPGKLVAGAIMLAAAATNRRPAVGDHGQVRM
jgi:general stress protein 26